MRVILYTDGSCEPNPGIGGWGVLVVRGSRRTELRGGDPRTTNNRMELLAAIRGLEALTGREVVTVISDSRYLVDGMTRWVHGWKKRGWRRGEGWVLNVDLWRRLVELAAVHRVTWRWVRGHSGHGGNEHADRLAEAGRLDAAAALRARTPRDPVLDYNPRTDPPPPPDAPTSAPGAR